VDARNHLNKRPDPHRSGFAGALPKSQILREIKTKTMHKLTVLYGHPANPDEFENYYMQNHLPLAAKIPGVSRFELTKLLTAPDGGKPAFYRMAELYYNEKDELEQSLKSPEAQAATGDLSNFATGGFTFIIGKTES
jgi:uncharacterized protein (TIGR02118 family)